MARQSFRSPKPSSASTRPANRPAPQPSTADWLNQSNTDWLSSIAERTGARLPPQRAAPAPAVPITTPRPLARPRLSPITPEPTKQDTQAQMNNERELLLRTLMASKDTNQFIPWKGGRVTIGEAIKDMLKGDEGAVVAKPQPQATPGQQTAPGVKPSQAAFDGLSQKQYDELSATGGIEGVTRPLDTRVSVRQGGSLEIRRSFNPDTGAVEAGRPADWPDFDAIPGHKPTTQTRD